MYGHRNQERTLVYCQGLVESNWGGMKGKEFRLNFNDKVDETGIMRSIRLPLPNRLTDSFAEKLECLRSHTNKPLNHYHSPLFRKSVGMLSVVFTWNVGNWPNLVMRQQNNKLKVGALPHRITLSRHRHNRGFHATKAYVLKNLGCPARSLVWC